jgi:RNA polymerase sigma-70 factor (ECF subfamily)
MSAEISNAFDIHVHWSHGHWPHRHLHLAGRRSMHGDSRTQVNATFAQHRAMLEAMAIRLCGNEVDGNDLVQDTLERALRATESHTPENARAWLITMMHNLFVDRCRVQSRQPELVPIDDEDNDVPEPDPEVVPEWATISPAQLEAALSLLDDRFRRVYELHALSGASYDEIAETLSIPRNTVGTRLARARQKVRELLRAQLSGRSAGSRQDYDHAV